MKYQLFIFVLVYYYLIRLSENIMSLHLRGALHHCATISAREYHPPVGQSYIAHSTAISHSYILISLYPNVAVWPHQAARSWARKALRRSLMNTALWGGRRHQWRLDPWWTNLWSKLRFHIMCCSLDVASTLLWDRVMIQILVNCIASVPKNFMQLSSIFNYQYNFTIKW